MESQEGEVCVIVRRLTDGSYQVTYGEYVFEFHSWTEAFDWLRHEMPSPPTRLCEYFTLQGGVSDA